MALPRANGSSYDVFLSFRGEDTRHSFTDHLYAALKQAGIKAFRDSDDAERGEELKQEIHGAIETSDASIIVLSENYATSTWCLDELSLILDRRRDCHHFVLPVFYKVDPSDVGQQKGTFFIEANLNSSSRRWTDDNVNRWKAALTEVVGIIGMSLVGSETEFLKKVVGTIYNRLDRKQIYIPPNLTGMDAREKEIKSWINQSESKFLLIYGMAGSGKSTLAQYIVYSNFQSFESVSIVEHIGRKCKEPHDMVKLQEQLCKDMLRGKDRRIPSVCQGTPTIEVLLEQKKALIVLDDIVKESQLEDLLGSGNINNESKIIVTTDNDVSNWFKLKSRRCEEYKMKLLDDEESLELLSLHAFQSKTPMDGFKELAKRVVEYCEGSPLALKVLGSSLSKDNSIRSWESALKLFGKDFHSDIYGVLKRSYDSLPYDSDKELFLHIACFFVGKDMDYIVQILEPEYSAESKIKTLIKRCFLYVTPNKQLMMHRLLQDMGRSLVDRESRKLAARSRLWRNKDSYDMLRRGKSSDLLKGLTLDMQMLMEENEFNSKQLKESPLTTDSLQRMDQLKLLQLNYVKLTGSYKDSSHHLLWLCWFGYNESIIDSDIFMGNMVALDLSYSCLKEFEPPTVLQSLKILNFKDSRSLLEIRNIHLIPNLETLILWNCHCLLRVCKTIENLEKLALLNMTGCENLYDKKQLNSLVELKASTSGGESTQELSFPLPLSLQRLFLNNCKLECTDYFPLSFSDQSSLQYLNLGNSLFEELPCYVHLKNLRVLDLSLCSRLISLLCLPSTLAELYVCYCKSIEKITFESGRFTLQEFGYEGCINLSEIEGLLKLVLIAKLDETDLGHMMWLKEYENHDVCLVGDDGLTKDRSCHLQMLYEFDIMSTSLPDIKHPNLTPEYASQYTCLSFDVPSCPRSRSLKGLDVTFRYRISGEDWAWFCKISVTGVDDLIYNPKVFGKPASGKVGIWLSYWPIGNSLVVGDEVKVSIIVMRGLEVLECGARLVYTDDDVTGEILENKVGWVETLGGDLSGFQLTTGAYYLCRRDFFEQMEVGKINPGWFNILVGDYIDSTVVRGWRMTGRPQQLYQSFTELKTISCIMYEPETEKIYKISEMSESSFVDETTMATSTILRDTMESGTRSEFSDSATKAMDISRARVINKTMKLMCSYGGHIIPRPHDKSLCYLGGETRIVVADRHTSLEDLCSRLSTTLLHGRQFSLKYQLPSEDLDSLVSITTDEDLENMIEEYDRLNSSNPIANKPLRLRLFLFLSKPETAASMGSLLDNAKSETWFVDALNGAGLLPRGFSDTASMDNLLEHKDGVIQEGVDNNMIDYTDELNIQQMRRSMESGTRSEFSDSATKAMDISRARVINKTMKSKSSSLDEDEEEEKGELDGIKERISSIQEKIMAWEGNDEAMIWDCDPEEAKKYVKTVDEARRLAESLESLNLSKDDGGLLRNVNTVIQTSMARIEEEFRHMLVNNRQNIGAESLFLRSTGDSSDELSIFSAGDDSVDDSTQSGAEVFIMDLVNPRVIPDLKCIANLMFDSNYGQECSQAFISARKDALDDCLFILEVEKFSIEDVLKMEWVALDSKIRRWTKAMRIFVQVYLASEKLLCEQIFGETEPLSSICFSESSKTYMLPFLNFAEAIAIGPLQPEKLVRILDMYKLLSDLMPDIEVLYSEESGSYIRIKCQDVLTRVGNCVKATFIEFENLVGSNTSNSAFPGGRIHPLTRFVMNYIRTLTDYHDSLNACLKDQDRVADGQDSSTPLDASPGNDDDNNNSSSSPMVVHFRSVMSILECNLEENSKLYKDEALGHLFMMNNIHYMAEKVKNSELRNFLGDDWIRKCNRNFQQYAMNYERATWSSSLNLLKEYSLSNSGSSGSTFRTLLRERLQAFYAAFEEIYNNQTGWTVPNTQLREDLRISVSTKVIQAYRTFIGRHTNNISEKYIKYTADDLQNYILDLFEGTPKSLHNFRK